MNDEPVLDTSSVVSDIDLVEDELDTKSHMSLAGKVSIEDLIQECLNPNKRSASEECVTMLDSYFIDQQYVPPGRFFWLVSSQRMFYRRIFENPENDRDLVFEALERSECQFENGISVRPDLSKTCHAESFTAFASFLGICKLNRESSFFYVGDIARSFDWTFVKESHQTLVDKWVQRLRATTTKSDGTLSVPQYTRLKTTIWENTFKLQWYRWKCTKYERNSMLFEPLGNNQAQYEKVHEIGTRLGVQPTEKEERDSHLATIRSFDLFYAIAAHLGDISASFRFAEESVFGPHRVDVSLITYHHEQYPWMKNFYDAGYLGTYTGDVISAPSPAKKFTEFVNRNIKGLIALDDAGLKYDLQMLVDQICRVIPSIVKRRTEDIISCRTAIDKLNANKHIGFEEGLMLDKFEQTAVELGVEGSLFE